MAGLNQQGLKIRLVNSIVPLRKQKQLHETLPTCRIQLENT